MDLAEADKRALPEDNLSLPMISSAVCFLLPN